MREELFTGRSSSSTSRASGITVAPTATRQRYARGCTSRWARRSGRPDSRGSERIARTAGDGIFILLPPEVPKSLLVELLPSALVASLTAHNRAHRDEERIRLRMSLHAGEVLYDPYGVTGEAINWAFRLVDAEPLKTALARSPGVLAIIASSWFFDQVIRHAAPDVPPAYRPVLVRAKDDTQPGWICLPDHRPPAPVTSPYKGLRAFEKQDRDLFFGRDSAVRQVMDGVAASALVPVVGASGIGKSSLVQAGLLPCLEKEKTSWGVETILPRPNLPMALAAALARLSGAPPIVPPLQLEAWQDDLAVHGLAAAAEKACHGRWEHAVIVIDQFEEALVPDGESDPILRQLGDLRDGGILTVVLTLRGDSFGKFVESQESFGEPLRRNAIVVRGMDERELREAIRRPAERHGFDVTDPLVDELVEAIRDSPGALPFLEFSLDQMWRTLPPRQLTLSSDEYRRIHGLNGALSAHADQVLNSLSEAERALVRSLFVNHLTSVDQPGVRRVIRRSECGPGYWPVIVRLAGERLLTVGCDEHGHETAEVVHEALLRGWNQLHVWLDAERPFRRWRQRLREDMKPWLETGDDRELMTGSPLAISERWRKDREDDLDLDELRYITASVSQRTEQEDRYRTLYGRARAREWTHRAESAQDPQLALLYALEVIKLSPDAASRPAGPGLPAPGGSRRAPGGFPPGRPGGSRPVRSAPDPGRVVPRARAGRILAARRSSHRPGHRRGRPGPLPGRRRDPHARPGGRGRLYPGRRGLPRDRSRPARALAARR